MTEQQQWWGEKHSESRWGKFPDPKYTTSLDEVSLALQWLERNPQLSLANRMEDWASQGLSFLPGIFFFFYFSVNVMFSVNFIMSPQNLKISG